MSNIPDSVEFSRSGNSVFENVYVYETLYVSKIVFDGDVDLDKLNINKRLNVGADGLPAEGGAPRVGERVKLL